MTDEELREAIYHAREEEQAADHMEPFYDPPDEGGLRESEGWRQRWHNFKAETEAIKERHGGQK